MTTPSKLHSHETIEMALRIVEAASCLWDSYHDAETTQTHRKRVIEVVNKAAIIVMDAFDKRLVDDAVFFNPPKSPVLIDEAYDK